MVFRVVSDLFFFMPSQCYFFIVGVSLDSYKGNVRMIFNCIVLWPVSEFL